MKRWGEAGQDKGGTPSRTTLVAGLKILHMLHTVRISNPAVQLVVTTLDEYLPANRPQLTQSKPLWLDRLGSANEDLLSISMS